LYGPHFYLDEIDRPVVVRLLAYFLRDEALAEAEEMDLQKGILLIGKVGCGKTALLTLMRYWVRESLRARIVSSREIGFEFGRMGYDIIGKYTTHAFFPYSRTPRVYCFDDLGMEPDINYWETVVM